eukprot:403365061
MQSTHFLQQIQAFRKDKLEQALEHYCKNIQYIDDFNENDINQNQLDQTLITNTLRVILQRTKVSNRELNLLRTHNVKKG